MTERRLLTMRAGFAKTNITPPLGIELSGYGYYLERKGTHVVDPLYAHCLALENEQGEKFVLFSCDALGLNMPLCEKVRQHLLSTHHIPNEHVMIVSIHTHTGPSYINHEGCGVMDPAFIEAVTPQFLQAADEALADLKPVSSMTFGMATLPVPHAYNRTIPNGPVDDQVRSFSIKREDGKPIALLSYACHPVCHGRISGISADYPGACCRIMEEKGFECMYLNGLCGDIDPITKSVEHLESFAANIISCFNESAEALPLTVDGNWLKNEVNLMPVTKEDIRNAAHQATTREDMIPGADKVARVWEAEMLDKFDSLQHREDIHVAYLHLGGVPIVALPFEGFTQIGSLLREELGDKRALTLGCAEELLGYLPTRDDIARGTYAALESTFLYKRLPYVPGEAERIGTALGDMLRKA